MIVNRILAIAVALVGAIGAAHGTPVSVIDGEHDVVNGNNPGDLGISGLGHSVSLFDNTSSGWENALSSGDGILIIEQQRIFNPPTSKIETFIKDGGRVIELGGNYPAPAVLVNQLFGTSISFSFNFDGTFSKTNAADGTTFDDDPPMLFGLNSNHNVTSGGSSLPSNSEIFYNGSSEAGAGPAVFRSTLGSGDYFYLGYDYCCGARTASGVLALPSLENKAQRNDWYTVMDSAITFKKTGTVSVPVPPSIALLGIALVSLGVLRRRRGNGLDQM
jgi:hypothetical protein